MTGPDTENRWLAEINVLLNQLVAEVGRRAETHTHARRLYGDPRYSYIPFDNNRFLRALIPLRWRLHREGYGKPYTGHRPFPKFIDVGCGIGDKMMLARQLDFEVFGLETDPYLVRYAKRVFGITDSEKIAVKQHLPFIFHADALYHTYDSYQVIWINTPFQDYKLEARLERRVYSQAALGAFVIMQKAVAVPPKRDYIACKIDGSGVVAYRRVAKGDKKLVT